MELLENLFHWFTAHWKTLSAVAGGIGTVAGTAFKARAWLRARSKERQQVKQKEERAKLDKRGLAALQDPDLPRSSRGVTGAGDLLMRSADIAKALALDQDDVIESLKRLEARGRVRNAGGTLDNPSPCWHIIHR